MNRTSEPQCSRVPLWMPGSALAEGNEPRKGEQKGKRSCRESPQEQQKPLKLLWGQHTSWMEKWRQKEKETAQAWAEETARETRDF